MHDQRKTHISPQLYSRLGFYKQYMSIMPSAIEFACYWLETFGKQASFANDYISELSIRGRFYAASDRFFYH